MKNRMKRWLCLGLTIMLMSPTTNVNAALKTTGTLGDSQTIGTEGSAKTQEQSNGNNTNDKKNEAQAVEANKKDDDHVVIDNSDKPYLALGSDLSDEQKNTVLNLMGIKPEEMNRYAVSYVTNSEEHQYLDSYISSKEIGSKSWSSVVIVKRDKGSGVNISTKNINYCTVGMYKNACVTAGIADADIIVAGPSNISGTAALVGIFKAYSDMTGKQLKDDNVDTSLNELVLTGKLEDATGAKPEEVESMLAYLKQRVAEGALKDEDSISKAIDEACDKFKVKLTDEEKSQLIELLLKMKDLNLDVDSLISQAQSIYDKLSDFGIDTSSEDGIGGKVKGFFDGLIKTIKDIVSSLF